MPHLLCGKAYPIITLVSRKKARWGRGSCRLMQVSQECRVSLLSEVMFRFLCNQSALGHFATSLLRGPESVQAEFHSHLG
ncbi:hypothetical protein FKM82_030694 [Ascaphus truei]